MPPIVVLVANEPRLHREALAGALALLCPEAEVVDVDPWDIAAEVARRRPDVAICSSMSAAVEADVSSWVLLYPNGVKRVVVNVGGERAESIDVSLRDLTEVVDRAGALERR